MLGSASRLLRAGFALWVLEQGSGAEQGLAVMPPLAKTASSVSFSYNEAVGVFSSLKQDRRLHSVSRMYVQEKACASVQRKYGEG